MTDTTLQKKFAELLFDMPAVGVTDTATIPGRQTRTYRYIALNSLIGIVKPVFAKHELSFYQAVNFHPEQQNDGKGMQVGTVDTYIFDATDSLKVGSYPFVVVGDPQAVGSAVTYARRYGLSAALGIYPDKDDDGAAMRDYKSQSQQQSEPRINRDQAAQLTDQAKSVGANLLVIASQLRGSKVNRLSEITVKEAQQLSDEMNAMKA